jgi:hypothetical protein
MADDVEDQELALVLAVTWAWQPEPAGTRSRPD